MRQRLGFTLIELLIVVAIVAIIAAIAIPSYADYVRKGRRADALRGLQEIRMAQERYRADRPRYGTLAEIGNPVAANPYYAFAVAKVDPPAVPTFTVTATAQGTQAHDRQGAVTCDSLTIDQAGTKGPPGKEVCWRN